MDTADACDAQADGEDGAQGDYDEGEAHCEKAEDRTKDAKRDPHHEAVAGVGAEVQPDCECQNKGGEAMQEE